MRKNHDKGKVTETDQGISYTSVLLILEWKNMITKPYDEVIIMDDTYGITDENTIEQSTKSIIDPLHLHNYAEFREFFLSDCLNVSSPRGLQLFNSFADVLEAWLTTQLEMLLKNIAPE